MVKQKSEISKQYRPHICLLLSLVLLTSAVWGSLEPVSAATQTLSSLSAGDTVNFAGKEWIVLNPAAGYLFMKSSAGPSRFSELPRAYYTYDDTYHYNIGDYLNKTFYNTLSSTDRALIQDHVWDVSYETGSETCSVFCKIGMISYSEYNAYTSNQTDFSIIPLQTNLWWTLTATYYGYDGAWCVTPAGVLQKAPNSSIYDCHPTLYIDPDILVVDGAISPLTINGLTMHMSGSGPAAYTAGGSGTDWTFTVPQDTAPVSSPANYTMTSVTVNMTGADTTPSPITVTAVSGPGVPAGGTTYGTLIYNSGAWTLTPNQTQTFRTVGTWVLQATVPNTAGLPANTVNITLVVTPTQPVAISGLTMHMSGSGPATYTASGSGADWTFTVPQDTATTLSSANYTATSITADMTGADTTQIYPVSVISGPGVPAGGADIGALSYAGSAWTLTPAQAQTFETAGTWVFQCTVKDTSGTPTTVSITMHVVSVAKDILTFTVAGQVGASSIDTAGHAVTFRMPYGTDVTALTPAITVSPLASVSPASGMPEDFTNPVIYTVTAEDNSTRDWTVTCAVIPNTPVIVPGSGAYPLPGQITVGINAYLSVSQAVYYTINDGALTVSSSVYSAPFPLWLPAGATTVTAAVYDSDTGLWGDTATATYTAGVPTYTLTITAGTGGSITAGSSGNYAAGTVIAIAATPGSGYSFNKWTSAGGGTFASAGSAGTTFTMPANAATITATFTYNGSGGGDNGSSGNGGSGGGSGGGSSTTTYHATVSKNSVVETTLPVTVDTNTGSGVVDTETLAEKVLAGEGTTIIKVPSVPGVNDYTVSISASYLSYAQREGSLTLSTGAGSITVSNNMLAGVSAAGGKKAHITIGQGDKTVLAEDVKQAVGGRPLIKLNLTLDGEQTEWNNPDAPVTVSIPYTPTAGELADPEHIVVWYIDGSGKAVPVPSGRYDPATGTVTFTTTHFSHYAVACVHKTFGDLGGVEWARKAIEVMASKGVISGTGADTYSPAANITRADYLVLLLKTLGLAADFDGNFDDVQPGAYYYEACGIAKKLGIAAGSGDNRFNPRENISRQDMMVLAARALERFKGLKAASDNAILDKFSDHGDIAGYAAESLAALVGEGLIYGDRGKLNSRARTTRAEAAAFLYRIYNKY